MFEYQGHLVSLLWQLKQALCKSALVCWLSQFGSLNIGGLA